MQYFNGNSTTVIGAMNYYGDYTTECLLKKMTYHKKKTRFYGTKTYLRTLFILRPFVSNIILTSYKYNVNILNKKEIHPPLISNADASQNSRFRNIDASQIVLVFENSN